MLSRIEFKNYKILRDAELPLTPFTLIVGANGSGKTTALQALQLSQRGGVRGEELRTIGTPWKTM